jgi:hypothetical protein
MGTMTKRTVYKTGPNTKTTITQNFKTGRVTTSSSQKIGNRRFTRSTNSQSNRARLTKSVSMGDRWSWRESTTPGLEPSRTKVKKYRPKKIRLRRSRSGGASGDADAVVGFFVIAVFLAIVGFFIL